MLSLMPRPVLLKLQGSRELLVAVQLMHPLPQHQQQRSRAPRQSLMVSGSLKCPTKAGLIATRINAALIRQVKSNAELLMDAVDEEDRKKADDNLALRSVNQSAGQPRP